MSNNKRVFVGLSGGVDSAVSATLLQQHGYDVTGVFIKIYSPDFLECTWKQDRLDAMRVCVALGIPFLEIDLSEQYMREIVVAMIADYARGITPNPDVLCNKIIKFGYFAEWAFAHGADCLATGHYARAGEAGARSCLLRGIDKQKDQSYFLYRISYDMLAKTVFPIGEYDKSHVRLLASKFDLPVADKPDSQGLCFVGDVSMHDFLSKYIELRNGDVLNMQGNKIGEHNGAVLYTVGERRGILTSDNAISYVVKTDIINNTVTVSPDRSDCMTQEVSVSDLHIIDNEKKVPAELFGQCRYRETPVAIHAQIDGTNARIHFEKPVIAAPGQSLVLYDGDTVIGGGVISCNS